MRALRAVPCATSDAKRSFSSPIRRRCCSTRSGARPFAIVRLQEWSVRTSHCWPIARALATMRSSGVRPSDQSEWLWQSPTRSPRVTSRGRRPSAAASISPDPRAARARSARGRASGRGPPRVANVSRSGTSTASGDAGSSGMRPCSDRLRPRCLARWRSRTLCAAEPVKWTRYEPRRPGGAVMMSSCGPSRSARLARDVPCVTGSAVLSSPSCGRDASSRAIVPAGSSVSTSRSRSPTVSVPRRVEPAIVAERTVGTASASATRRSASACASPINTRRDGRRWCCSSDSTIPGLALGADAANASETAGRRRGLELLERRDPARPPQLSRGPRPDAGEPEHRRDAGGDLGAKLLELGDAAARRELIELVCDALPDPRQGRRGACAIGGHDLDRRACDRVSRPPVGVRLERRVALDVEQVGQLGEERRDPRVRQGERLVGQTVGHRGRIQAATTRSRPSRFAR